MESITHSPEETFALGERLARYLKPGAVVAFWGDLGAGKTVMIKGICKGLGIDAEDVTSPSFTVMNIYEGEIPVFHFDFYKIQSYEEVSGYGIEDYFYGEGISLIEWAERIESYLPEDRIPIVIRRLKPEHRKSENDRYISIGNLTPSVLTALKRKR
ncbi:MAG: tRNA (adenosine(37)-N6)-threonylcarbamoyltransferase complex ATPase subunit type 1 TsaE [Calditrichaeota bacterium]|nr:tRNA (adenosine(37)-N6)-threonylcarbamoyltransferase complex ATPase subunit type 1 TsaE [Calditrichota bacterium]